MYVYTSSSSKRIWWFFPTRWLFCAVKDPYKKSYICLTLRTLGKKLSLSCLRMKCCASSDVHKLKKSHFFKVFVADFLLKNIFGPFIMYLLFIVRKIRQPSTRSIQSRWKVTFSSYFVRYVHKQALIMQDHYRLFCC